MGRQLEIFVVSHACERFPNAEPFVPIQVGRSTRTIRSAVRDSSGDTISSRNEFYAELTAQYWVWKNRPRADRVGFFHYRRYLDFTDRLREFRPMNTVDFRSFDAVTMAAFGWSESRILEACGDADIVVPRKVRLYVTDPARDVQLDAETGPRTSIYGHFCRAHYAEAIDLALEVMAVRQPKYAEVAARVMAQQDIHLWNMFLMKADLFATYMDWLFGILFEMEPRMDLASPRYARETGQRRVFGFLGERLLNVFVQYQQERASRVVKDFMWALGDLM